MELLQLKYFCDAAQTENFSKTAAKFLVPPSNISQSIKRLEQELGSQLFTRSANRICLNRAGEQFYQKASAALELLSEGVNTVKNTVKRSVVRVNIHISRHVVMNAIEAFQRIHPEVSFVSTHDLSGNINDYDILITDRDLDTPYTKTKAATETLCLAYNTEHFRFEDTITADVLKDCHFITMKSGYSMHTNLHDICQSMGFTPRIALQSDDPFYVRKCVELGLGVAIFPSLSWQGLFSDLVTIKSIGDYKRNTYIYCRPGTEQHQQEFYQMLVAFFQQQ